MNNSPLFLESDSDLDTHFTGLEGVIKIDQCVFKKCCKKYKKKGKQCKACPR
jgi:hypothetical protein